MRIIFFSFLATLVVAILALAQTVSPPKALSIPDTLPDIRPFRHGPAMALKCGAGLKFTLCHFNSSLNTVPLSTPCAPKFRAQKPRP